MEEFYLFQAMSTAPALASIGSVSPSRCYPPESGIFKLNIDAAVHLGYVWIGGLE